MFNVNQLCRTTIESGGIRINKLFNIRELRTLADTPWIFTLFGRRMAKLKITTEDVRITDPQYSNLDEFLRLLPNENVGRLTELDIGFRFKFTDHTFQLLSEKRVFFQNVVTLALTNQILRYLKPFLRTFPTEKLRTVVLNGQATKSNWLTSPALFEIQHLWVDSVVTDDQDINMDVFFMSHRILTTFRCRTIIGDRLVQFPTNGKYIEKIDNFGTISINNDANCLNLFKNLKCLELSTKYVNGGDIFELLKRVQNKHMLIALVLNIFANELNPDQIVNIDEARSTMAQFTDLTHLYLDLNGDEPWRFLRNILPYFSSVTDVVFSGDNLKRIHVLLALELLPNIRAIIVGENLELPTDFYGELIQNWQRKRLDCPIEVRIKRNDVNEWRSQIGDSYNENFVALKIASPSDFKYDALLQYSFINLN